MVTLMVCRKKRPSLFPMFFVWNLLEGPATREDAIAGNSAMSAQH
jgi:hypothetical protein